MAGRPKSLVGKEFRNSTNHLSSLILSDNLLVSGCGYAIVEKIVMAKRNTTDQFDHTIKQNNTYNHYVFYEATRSRAK